MLQEPSSGEVRARPDDALVVAVVTRDVSARAELARQLPGDAVLLLFPDQLTAARMLADGGQPGPEDSPGWPDGDGMIRNGNLLIDPLRLEVTWNGSPVRLTRLERAVLARLAEPPLRAWTYERLYRAAWGGAWLGDASALHATVKRLRRKLSDAGVTLFPESIRGVGFRLGTVLAPAGRPAGIPPRDAHSGRASRPSRTPSSRLSCGLGAGRKAGRPLTWCAPRV